MNRSTHRTRPTTVRRIKAPVTRKSGAIFPGFRVLILLILYAGSALCAPKSNGGKTDVPLLPNLGDHHFPISTHIPSAQAYFDQGLILAFGFNHAEAAKYFKEAARRDPDCAMSYWGQALVLGPNINAPMDEAAVPEAYSATSKALSLVSDVGPKEQALIEALSRRYSKKAPKDRSNLDKAYADAMREVSKQFPQDSLIAALFAESLMDLHPWDYWTRQGKARPWTAEIVGTLERALELDPNHPLANHLYIHAMEASPHPEKALPSARRLPALVPGSGHLVHMPAHIYLRIGRYRDAALANEAAIAIDHDYLGHAHEESIYTRAYVPHNFHFLWAAAVKSGQSKLALQAAQDTAHKVDPKLLHDPAYSATLQHFSVIPLYTLVLFGKWPEILRQAEPAEDLLYAQGIWHYARGLALTRLGKTSKARRELRRLEEIRRDPAIGALKIFDVNPVEQILRIAEATLAGEIAAARKNYPEAVTHLQKAIEIEDSLNYTEPKDWYLPSRQVLGAILLESGDPLKAEKVFAEDLKIHPQNGWSLFGLAQSLNALGKNDQARKIGQDFEKAWQDADIQLKSARF